MDTILPTEELRGEGHETDAITDMIRPTEELRGEGHETDYISDTDLKSFGASPRDYADKLNAKIDAARARKSAREERRALLLEAPMSNHTRWGLECEIRGLIAKARHAQSPALRARDLAHAKRIADQLAADDRRQGRMAAKFAQRAADQLGVSKRTIERAVDVGSRILPNLAEAVAGAPYDNAHDLERLAELPLAAQHDFAQGAARLRYELLLAGEVLTDGRLRRLDHSVLDALDTLGRNDSQTRRRLASMSQRETIETVARWHRERDQHERRAAEIDRLRENVRAAIRTTARQTAQAAYDAMTAADKADFLEVTNQFISIFTFVVRCAILMGWQNSMHASSITGRWSRSAFVRSSECRRARARRW